MLFCKGEGKYESKGIGYQKNNHIFNVPVSEEEYKKAISSKPEFTLPLTKYENGKLITLSYKDAWKEGWANASKEFKDWVKSLPNFNKELFLDITGIDINECEVVKEGEIVEVCIRGKTFKAKIIK